MIKIISVVGARPNFMKIAPFIKAINKYNELNEGAVTNLLVHTGQHYDANMSEAFFKDLGIPKPDINLGVGSGSHAEQVGNTMIAFEKVLQEHKPDWVVVVGDVNATLACSITAKKEHIKCCHIEAGLRSGDMDMPEEINRIVTDRLSDLLLTPDTIANYNLHKEGVDDKKIRFVGNIMIDTLETNRNAANDLDITDFLINDVIKDLSIIWPVHPRCENKLKAFRLWDRLLALDNIILLQPIGYLEMLNLNMHAKMIITDSGGLQEECTILGTPCLTLRANTERPVTLEEFGGVSLLVGNDINHIREGYRHAFAMSRNPYRPELWDGHTAERVLWEIISYVSPVIVNKGQTMV